MTGTRVFSRGVRRLSQLADVSAVGRSANDVLVFNGTLWVPSSTLALDSLSTTGAISAGGSVTASGGLIVPGGVVARFGAVLKTVADGASAVYTLSGGATDCVVMIVRANAAGNNALLAWWRVTVTANATVAAKEVVAFQNTGVGAVQFSADPFTVAVSGGVDTTLTYTNGHASNTAEHEVRVHVVSATGIITVA